MIPIFEPHAHMFSRVTDDYQRMARAGVKVILEPAFWLGQPRTNLGSFLDYFDTLVGWERFRAAQFGVHHVCTMALNPREANYEGLNDEVLAVLPRYLEKGGVVGVGEIGLDDMTREEERIFEAQIQLAIEHDLPVLVHTPHRNKLGGFRRCLEILQQSGIAMDRVLLDHGNEETIKETLDAGCMLGFSIYPASKMDPARMVAILERYGVRNFSINSATDWGVSDPLAVAKTLVLMERAGFAEAERRKLVWDNPVRFFTQSGRVREEEWLTPPEQDRTQTYTGNSVLRGQDPRFDIPVPSAEDLG